MKNHLNYLLVFALSAAVFGAVACSDDSSSSVAADDGKSDVATWEDLQHFDDLADLPSCEKFEGVAAQVIDEKGFFACSDNEWLHIGISVPAYDKLPKCEASMNDFCVYIEENEKIEASYICDEGTWVRGVQIDGVSLCLKGGENSFVTESRKKMIEDAKKNFEEELEKFLKEYEESEEELDESSKEKIEVLKETIEKLQKTLKELEISDDELLEAIKAKLNSGLKPPINQLDENEKNPIEDYVKNMLEKALENKIQEIANESKEKLEAEAKEDKSEFDRNNLTTSSENIQSAESTFSDADMAKEMTEFTKNNILTQTAQAMLAQANQMGQGVLSLLQ